jgi:hypothetical protein
VRHTLILRQGVKRTFIILKHASFILRRQLVKNKLEPERNDILQHLLTFLPFLKKKKNEEEEKDK